MTIQELTYQAVTLHNGYAASGGMSAVACPQCGEFYGMEHGDEVYMDHPDHDDYDSPAGTRGGYIETRGECACGAEYSFVIGNHKGSLILAIAVLNPEDFVDEGEDDDDE